MQPTNSGPTSTNALLRWSLIVPVLVCICLWLTWYAGSIQASARDATAIVYVANQGVDVEIDDQSFHIRELRSDPLVFSLPAGKYELIMSRAGEILYRQAFELERGEERTLSAWWTPPGAVDPSSDTH